MTCIPCSSDKGEHMWWSYFRYEDTPISRVFMGQLRSTLTCSVCNNASTTFDPFWDIALPMPHVSFSMIHHNKSNTLTVWLDILNPLIEAESSNQMVYICLSIISRAKNFHFCTFFLIWPCHIIMHRSLCREFIKCNQNWYRIFFIFVTIFSYSHLDTEMSHWNSVCNCSLKQRSWEGTTNQWVPHPTLMIFTHLHQLSYVDDLYPAYLSFPTLMILPNIMSTNLIQFLYIDLILFTVLWEVQRIPDLTQAADSEQTPPSTHPL